MGGGVTGMFSRPSFLDVLLAELLFALSGHS